MRMQKYIKKCIFGGFVCFFLAKARKSGFEYRFFCGKDVILRKIARAGCSFVAINVYLCGEITIYYLNNH